MVTLLRLLNVKIMTKSLAVFTCKIVLLALFIACGFMFVFLTPVRSSAPNLVVYAKYNGNKSIQINFMLTLKNIYRGNFSE